MFELVGDSQEVMRVHLHILSWDFVLSQIVGSYPHSVIDEITVLHWCVSTCINCYLGLMVCENQLITIVYLAFGRFLI